MEVGDVKPVIPLLPVIGVFFCWLLNEPGGIWFARYAELEELFKFIPPDCTELFEFEN